MDREAFEKELDGYSQEELYLIYRTQQDVYSPEEIEMIGARLHAVPEAVTEKPKTSPLTVLCYVLSCIVPLFGLLLGAVLRSEQDERRKRLGGDFLVCGCLPAFGLGVIIGGILLASNDEQKKSLGKKCMATSFISLMLLMFFWSGGFRI